MSFYYKVKLDYNTTNFWKYSINDHFIDMVEEEELKLIFPEEYDEIIRLNEMYNNMFINNETEFYYTGFDNFSDYIDFKNSWSTLIAKLRNKYDLKIIDNIRYED